MSSAFEQLSRPVQKWIARQEWPDLRPIQVDSINTIFNTHDDMIISASTAGGKTEAAFLPLISQVLDDRDDERKGFDLLYIGPLKALITDQSKRLKDIAEDMDIPVFPWHGDIAKSTKDKAFESPRGILLITPESLESMMINRGGDIKRLFGNVKAVIIDEIHSMLGNERGIQLNSLLTRLEISTKKEIRRIGLSATLGNMDIVKSWLRPDRADDVKLIEDKNSQTQLMLQLRGYQKSGKDEDAIQATTRRIAHHLFENFRGSDNLIFANSRNNVELYSDMLRTYCEDNHLPQEFYTHHGNISTEDRRYVEKRLKDSNMPTTAICTSTLELGIDIGDVTRIGQIGAPFSVASLRQRIGRSGRREGQPAILYHYVIGNELNAKSDRIDRLHLDLIRSMAMIELLLEKWNESPKEGALHLSTLTHQILSIIAQYGGARANSIYNVLCKKGPFRNVSSEIFIDILRAIGRDEVNLIEQTDSGLLHLGEKGEQLVENYSFYAAFQTPDEYRLISNGKELGRLPVNKFLMPGMLLIFSGKKWTVQSVNNAQKTIIALPSLAGKAPIFGGEGGSIDDHVIGRMFEILERHDRPGWMDENALTMLDQARYHYHQLGFGYRNILPGEDESIILTRMGTAKTSTLAMALQGKGFKTGQHDGILRVESDRETQPLMLALARLGDGENPYLFSDVDRLDTEKYHKYLTRSLLEKDMASSKLEPESLADLVKGILHPEMRENPLQNHMDEDLSDLNIEENFAPPDQGENLFKDHLTEDHGFEDGNNHHITRYNPQDDDGDIIEGHLV